ncbi:MAG: tRNA (adenosine(37)-N6)-threonylcarbamoyltransferase complex ATPase subunit type 1 TsaE [Clostridia bacterium]|nr:tRNA (adenosine(37)-N6)-threonylcarbamoyltransferase complex ATPase subunit type 1 TsaE [Clostridia bacterium]
MAVKIISKSGIKTANTGAKLAKVLKPGSLVLLDGDLGAGKTVFVRGMCKALGVAENVTSPTFALINTYKGILPASGGGVEIVHCDAYRLSSMEELYDAGFFDFGDDAVLICEWSENVFAKTPPGSVRVRIERRDDISANYREIYITGEGEGEGDLEAAFR